MIGKRDYGTRKVVGTLPEKGDVRLGACVSLKTLCDL